MLTNQHRELMLDICQKKCKKKKSFLILEEKIDGEIFRSRI